MTSRSPEKTRVIYVSSMMRAETYDNWFHDAAMHPSQATQKYDCLLVDGLAANGAEVVALCAPPLTRHTCGRRFAHLRPETDGGVSYRYFPVVDVPVLKNCITWAASFFHTLLYTNRRTEVLCYGLNVSAAAGARAAAKLLHRPVTVIVSDVPEQLYNSVRMRMAQRALGRYDAYILLAGAMNSLVNPHGKPYIVLEGQADAGMAARENTLAQKHREKICLYAGMLHAKYGVLRLVEAFTLLDDPDARLVLYGTGDAAAQISAAAAEDARIAYRGVADNAEVVSEEIRATLLINPRPSDETYTRYSFPSKNLEYMVSGTPLLTTDLPGMPEAYRAHVYLFTDETPAGMAKTLHSVLSQPREALHAKGCEAKEFVLQNKSNVAQARRILTFMEGNAT